MSNSLVGVQRLELSGSAKSPTSRRCSSCRVGYAQYQIRWRTVSCSGWFLVSGIDVILVCGGGEPACRAVCREVVDDESGNVCVTRREARFESEFVLACSSRYDVLCGIIDEQVEGSISKSELWSRQATRCHGDRRVERA